MKIRHNKSYSCRGVTIIELMVALTLSVILLGGVYTVYISSKTSYKRQEGLSRIQESARFAMDFLAQDVRIAGLVGCDSKSGEIAVNSIAIIPNGTDPDVLTFGGGSDGIEGFEEDSISTAELDKIGLTAGDVIADTDIIQIKALSNADCQVVEKDNGANPFTAEVKVVTSCQVQQDEIVLISDCKNADLFGVSNVRGGNARNGDAVFTLAHGANNNTDTKLSNVYGGDAEVLRFENIIYFIGTGASGEPALMRRRLVANGLVTEEIVDGVEDMQVQYGVDTNNDAVANRYVDADDALINGDFTRVMSVRIALLMRTTSVAGNVYGDPTSGEVTNTAQPFIDLPFLLSDTDTSLDIAGQNIDLTTPNDGRLRRPFVSVIKIRNRLF